MFSPFIQPEQLTCYQSVFYSTFDNQKQQQCTPLYHLSSDSAGRRRSPLSPRVASTLHYTTPLRGYKSAAPTTTFNGFMPSPPDTPLRQESQHAPMDASSPLSGVRNKLVAITDTKRIANANLNPLVKTTEQRTRQRREGFLNRVKERQADRRWEIKSDQILHNDYLEQRRAWERELANSAPSFELDEMSDDDPFPQSTVRSSTLFGGSQGSSHFSQSPQQPEERGARSIGPGTGYRQGHTYPEQELAWLEGGDEAEIEDLLAAEARELDELVALYEPTELPPPAEPAQIPDFDDEDLWSDSFDVADMGEVFQDAGLVNDPYTASQTSVDAIGRDEHEDDAMDMS